MASAEISLKNIVKEIDLVAGALGGLRKGASPAQKKSLNARIKKLGALKSRVKILCHHSLNVNPSLPPSKKMKK